jgi:hypothetical protein
MWFHKNPEQILADETLKLTADLVPSWPEAVMWIKARPDDELFVVLRDYQGYFAGWIPDMAAYYAWAGLIGTARSWHGLFALPRLELSNLTQTEVYRGGATAYTTT